MYRYLDRDLAALDETEQMLVRAMRDWVVARQRGRCPTDSVLMRFLSHRLIGGLEPFHQVMTLLSARGLQRLEIGCPCTSTVTEGEAILLSVMRSKMQDSAAWAEQVAGLLPDRGRQIAADALGELSAALALAGLA